MRILIVKLGAIGDVLRTVSILPGLKNKYPDAEINWLTEEKALPVLFNNPYIAKSYQWEEREKIGSYDLVIGLEEDFGVCDFISKIKTDKIIGAYVQAGKITYNPSAWFDMSVISKFGIESANKLKKQNRKTYQQHMAELLGIEVKGYVFSLTKDEIEDGRRFFEKLGFSAEDRVVGVNTGAGKRWPLKSIAVDKTIELVNRLKNELGVDSIILGGEEEKERNRIICQKTGMPSSGARPLRDFAAIINQCRCLVTSDSLAMHLGIALAKPVVVFFGPTSSAEIELYGRGTKVVADIDCLACYKKGCDITNNCIDLLSLDKIVEEVKKLI